MAGYSPLKITGNSTGLVQEREEYLLPDDAYPTLQNAYVWRERILRKKGYQLLGRLQRSIDINYPLIAGLLNFIAAFSLQATSTIVPGSINLVGSVDGTTYTDPDMDGVLVATGGTGTGGTINYSTTLLQINDNGLGNQAQNMVGTIEYYPGLPVMGIRLRELTSSAVDQTVIFDQVYAYIFDPVANEYEEFIPGTTWNAHGGTVSAVDFFWSTNYWVSSLELPPAGSGIPFFTTSNIKLFWVTNNTGQFGINADPVRITDGTTWVDFSPPNFGRIDATNYLVHWLCMIPFRGRMVTFNTWEGADRNSAINYSNRIRWATIGNPFILYSAAGGGLPARGSWRSDIRGQGGFLDIPTSEDIVSIGFVRDNLVVYCERSTWQLRYTGRSIAPFQIEKVNSELGAESTFAAIQFDTSLVTIGDKGITECDSYKSERIDIKIPDFVYKFQANNNGLSRVQGVRDFVNRLAFWTITLNSANSIFPTQRLVYNYENDSWALFNDSLTALGTYQVQSSRTWLNTKQPWIECDFPWVDNQPVTGPTIIGGNQQGFIETLDQLNNNDPSLYISGITANTTTATRVTSPNHNMKTGFVIGISNIPTGTPFDNLNGGVFGITVPNANQFDLFTYNTSTGQFSDPQLDIPTTAYVGGGLINIRENFSIVSKKFNFLDEGQSIQIGFIDILMAATESNNPGAITLNVYLDYNDSDPSNTYPENEINDGSSDANPDTFFNSVIPTTTASLNSKGGTKFWQRVYCPTRANFLTLEYTFSNGQMAGQEQELKVQIDAQVLWIRKAGQMTQI